jgi:hypothetical protein
MKLSTIVLLLSGMFLSATAFSQLPTTISALRSTASPSTTQPYFVTDPGREGIFYYDRTDLNSADNGGTVLVSGTKRYKRVYNGSLDVRWFGAKGDYNGTTGTDNAPAINAAIAAAKKGETVTIPSGQYRVFTSIAMPTNINKKIKFDIYGDIYFSKGAGFIIEGEYQIFKSHGLICGMNSGATTEATYAAYAGTGIYIKNAVNCKIEVNEIKDFKYGIVLSAESSSGGRGCQYNNISFNAIHHNHTQIRIIVQGTSPNWNTSSFWHGGQLGRGIPHQTYGQGGWYGVVMSRDAATPGYDPINGHTFHDVAFEGLEHAMVLTNANYNSLIGGRIEPFSIRTGFNLDPKTCNNNKFVGVTYLEESMFVTNRIGTNTIITGTPFWGGGASSATYMGASVQASVTPNKFLINTGKYSYTSFMVNKAHDLISETGQYPTLQAMMYRINGVIRSVPFKKTFLHVKSGNTTTPIALPANIGLVRVESTQAKTFKIDTGDLAMNGEEFLVEYLTPKFPITFVHGGSNATLIQPKEFNSYGVYRCLWVDGVFRVSKIGGEYKTVTQTGPNYTVADGTQTHYVNYGATATVTLPPASSWPSREIIIKNLQAGRTVQVVGVSASDESIIQGRGAMTVKSDGTTWNIISFYKRNITY